ncbi:hybrid sensor histidine kinase/response regulator [Stutzerimonas nosocomialis]|uniref:ATP-binding protein n=1 Tax=Stutzerimonas nosocomialis TaxID=1056496 RepID=UPI0011093772|nr:ATP-binding protein [Stutzerimonas nosocomialis]TLX53119.1 hybrid sensor histidine kinase/response regulator [Stutzerimonas nosocomialis]
MTDLDDPRRRTHSQGRQAQQPKVADQGDVNRLLAASEERYRTLFKAIDSGFCIVEMRFDDALRAVDYRVVEGNPAFERMTGLFDADGKWVSEIAPDLERHWFDLYGRVALTGEPVRFENAAEPFGCWYDVQALRIGEPSERRVAILFNDISERRQAELALARSEEHWRSLFESLSEAFIIGQLLRDEAGHPVDWRYLDINPAWARMTGVPAEDATGRTVREIFPGVDPAWISETAQVVASGHSATFTRQIAGRWYEGRAHRVDAHRVDDERFAIIFRDVTESRKAEVRRNGLLELGDRLRNMSDPTEMSYVAAELLGTTLGVNQTGYCMLDPDTETALLERDWVAPNVPSNTGEYRMRDFGSFMDDLGRGETVAITDTHLDPRTRTHVEAFDDLSVRALLNVPVVEHGRTVAFIFANCSWPRPWEDAEVAFAREVVERTRAAIERRRAEDNLRELNARLESLVAERTAELLKSEELLRQSQKMEAVGQLTGGLAHDFNNLLAGIGGSLELLGKRLQQGRLDELPRYLDAAQSASRRAAALTHRLLAFSRRQTLDPRPTDVNRLVDSMEELVRRTMGPEVVIEVVRAAGLWSTLVDPNQLENTLLNLCINARDAMPSGGRLTVETSNRWLDTDAARELDVPPGRYVSLSVTDTGSGMPPEVLNKAFDPFFTTKPLGMGTGLGLSMIYGFARQSGGQVVIQSRPDEGTRVSVLLPRHFQQAGAAEPFPAHGEPPRAVAGQTVLVVDDEPTIRMLVCEILEELGYAAIEAEDGATGLKVLQSDRRIDLLVSDVGLPGGMNGRQMADAARVGRPGLKVLFITGYAETAAAIGSAHLEAGMYVMTKPFDIEALAVRIKELIGD